MTTMKEIKERCDSLYIAMILRECRKHSTMADAARALEIDRSSLYRIRRRAGATTQARELFVPARYLTGTELDDYRLLRNKYRHSIEEALKGIGRADLIAKVPR